MQHLVRAGLTGAAVVTFVYIALAYSSSVKSGLSTFSTAYGQIGQVNRGH